MRRQKVKTKREIMPVLPVTVATKLLCKQLILIRQIQLVYQ